MVRATGRWLRRLLAGLFGLMALLVSGLGVALMWLQSEGGRDWAVARVEALASSETVRIEIDDLSGRVPTDMHLGRVSLADATGVWLEGQEVRLAWRLLPLLSGRLEIEALTADALTVFRTPAGGTEEPPPPSDEPFVLPDLPVAVLLDRLSIGTLRLDEALAGQAATLTVEAEAQVLGLREGITAALAIDRRDGVGGSLSTQARFIPAENTLSLTLALREPAGGMLARVAGLPGQPEVLVTLTGDGPLDGWEGQLVGRAGDLVALESRLRVERAGAPDAYRLSASVYADPGGLLPAALRPALGDWIDIYAAVVAGPDRPIEVEALTVDAAAARLQAAGTVDLQAGTLDLAADASVRSAPLSGLTGGATWQRATVEVTATGALTAPSATLDGTVVGPALDAIGAERVALRAEVSVPDGQLDAAVTLRVDAPRLGRPDLDPLLPPQVTVTAAAALGADGVLLVPGYTVDSALVSLSGSARYDTDSQDARATLRAVVPALAPLQPLIGQPIAGAAALDAEVAAAVGWSAFSADARLRLSELSTGIAEANALLGPMPELAVSAVLTPGRLEVERATVEAAALELTANGVQADGRVTGEAEATVTLPEEGPLPASGTLTLAAVVEGTLEALSARLSLTSDAITAGGETVRDLDLAVTADDLPAAPSAVVALGATVRGQPVDARARVAVVEGDRVRVSQARLAGLGLTLTGEGATTTDGLVEARLDLSAPSLSGVAALAAPGLSGSASGTVRLTPTAQDGQTVALSLEGRALSLGPTGAVETLQLDATVRDALQAPSIQGDLRLSGLTAAEQRIDQAVVTVGGVLDALEVAVSVTGDDLQLAAEAGVAASGTPARVDLQALQATRAERTLRLTQPARIIAGPERIAVEGLRLTAAGGQVALDLERAGSRIDLDLDARDLPVDLITLVAPDLALAGTLSATASVSGSLPAPEGQLRVRTAGLRVDLDDFQSVDGLDLQADARWSDGVVTTTATFTAPKAGRIDARGELPLRLDARSLTPILPSPAPIDGRVQGEARLSALDDFLAARGDRAAGLLTIDLTVAGSVQDPDFRGAVTLSDVRYQAPTLGTRVLDLDARLVGDPEGVRIETFQAALPDGGRLSVDGRVRIGADGIEPDVTLTARDALVIATDLAEVTIDADLAFAGNLQRRPGVSGRVAVQEAEIRIPETLPPNTPQLDVVAVNVPPDLADRRRTPEPAGRPLQIALDLAIDAPREVFVRGRGLTAELGGRFAITGTADAPDIAGNLSLLEGDLDFLGQNFTFTRGALSLGGVRGEINPLIDFRAETDIDQTRIAVLVGGTAQSPDIDLESTPDLPQDEIIARLLFGTGIGSLTPFQAAQLAQNVAELTGTGFSGGGGLVDQVRRGLTLDRLAIEGGGAAATGGASIEAGRYIGDRVFVGVNQALQGGGGQVTVEVELTPNLTLESDVGAETEGSIGLNWEWEY